MSELPKSICRMAKRLLKLAKENGGSLAVPNLSAAQEITSKIHGAQSSFDALVPGTETPRLNEIALALAVGELVGSDAFSYHYRSGDPIVIGGDVVFRISSNDLQSFAFRDEGHGPPKPMWNPHGGPRSNMKYEICINFFACKTEPTSHSILMQAKELFKHLDQQGGGFGFVHMVNSHIQKLAQEAAS